MSLFQMEFYSIFLSLYVTPTSSFQLEHVKSNIKPSVTSRWRCFITVICRAEIFSSWEMFKNRHSIANKSTINIKNFSNISRIRFCNAKDDERKSSKSKNEFQLIHLLSWAFRSYFYPKFEWLAPATSRINFLS